MTEDHLRSFLFVPATRPDRIGKALAGGADAVIVDLEDAVPADAKDQARSTLVTFFEQNPDVKVLVRINSADTDAFEADLALCRDAKAVFGVMLAKADSAKDIEYTADTTKKPVWPLIESGAGIAALAELVNARGIARLSIGALDLASDLGLTPDTPGAEKMLDHCRSQLAIHSRAAGLAPPVETVVPVIDQPDVILQVAINASQMGFTGMLAIHPAQLPAIHQAFTPNASQVEWAQQIVAGAAEFGAVFQLNGKMVDAPVIKQAHNILARAQPQT